MSELDYEELAKQIANLYVEKPELAFKLFDWLRKYFVTTDDLKQYMEQSRVQFQELLQEMNNRFEEMNKRFEENREETNKRFEAIDQRFEILTSYIDRRFKELALGYGGTFEGFNKTILKKILAERGIPIQAFNVTPLHFQDSAKIVHSNTTDVEINIFNENPPIIGEVTSSLVDFEDLNIFIRKIQFIEKKYKKKFQRFFITLYIDDKIKEPCQALFKKYAIEVITLE